MTGYREENMTRHDRQCPGIRERNRRRPAAPGTARRNRRPLAGTDAQRWLVAAATAMATTTYVSAGERAGDSTPGSDQQQQQHHHHQQTLGVPNVLRVAIDASKLC